MSRSGEEAEGSIYVCDLDGTLLGSDGKLSEFSRRGLCRLLDAGARVTVASARGTPGMRALLAGVPFGLPVIELNGAFVSELESGRHLVSNTLTSKEACAAVGVILETGVDPVLSSWDGQRDLVHFGTLGDESTTFYVTEKQAYGDPRLAPCEDLLAAAGREDVAQITTFALDADAEALVTRLRRAVGKGAVVHAQDNTYCPGWTEIVIQHCASEKGAAIPALLGACEAADAEVVACGDNLNDLGMFALAAQHRSGQRAPGGARDRHRGGRLQRRGRDRAPPPRLPLRARLRLDWAAMNRLRSHLTYANVMATIAVFVTLGGGAYAATQLERNSVGSKQIKKGAIKPSDLSPKLRKALAAKSVGTRGADGPRGADGSPGAQGPIGPSDAYFRAVGPERELNCCAVTELAAITVPAGEYLVTAKATIALDEYGLELVLRAGDTVLDVTRIAPGPGGGPGVLNFSLPLVSTGTAEVAAPTQVSLQAKVLDTDSRAIVRPDSLKLSALAVGEIT